MKCSREDCVRDLHPFEKVEGENPWPGSAFHGEGDYLPTPIKYPFHPECFPFDDPTWIGRERAGALVVARIKRYLSAAFNPLRCEVEILEPDPPKFEDREMAFRVYPSFPGVSATTSSEEPLFVAKGARMKIENLLRDGGLNDVIADVRQQISRQRRVVLAAWSMPDSWGR